MQRLQSNFRNIFTSPKIWTTLWWKPHDCRSAFAKITPHHERQMFVQDHSYYHT